jgi:hypothetical protein
MPGDDPVQLLLSRHIGEERTAPPAPPQPAVDPLTMARIYDMALSAINTVRGLATSAEAAVLIRQRRLQNDSEPNPRESAEFEPRHISIEF